MGGEGQNDLFLCGATISAGIGHNTGLLAGRLLGGDTGHKGVGVQCGNIAGFLCATDGAGVGDRAGLLAGGCLCGDAFIPFVGLQLGNCLQL